jgi:hypothetical protein
MATQAAYCQVAVASAVSPKPSPVQMMPAVRTVTWSRCASQLPVTGWAATITRPLTAMAIPYACGGSPARVITMLATVSTASPRA